MKKMKINTLRSIFAVAALVVLGSCSVIQDLEYNVVENPLQMHGGDVTLKVDVKFIEKGLNAKKPSCLFLLFSLCSSRPVTEQSLDLCSPSSS